MIADLANASLGNPAEQATARIAPHWLDSISKIAHMDISPIMTAHIPSISCTAPFEKPSQYWGIYIDNFCDLVQGNQ